MLQPARANCNLIHERRAVSVTATHVAVTSRLYYCSGADCEDAPLNAPFSRFGCTAGEGSETWDCEVAEGMV